MVRKSAKFSKDIVKKDAKFSKWIVKKDADYGLTIVKINVFVNPGVSGCKVTMPLYMVMFI